MVKIDQYFPVEKFRLTFTSPSPATRVIVMPKWILQCPNCKTDFGYSQINDVGMASYYLPLKPDLPPKGVKCTCPNCGSKATYQRKDLCYQA
jgi:hypothetical protein